MPNVVYLAQWFSKPACCSDHAICKDQGWSPTYDQWKFSTVTRFIYSKIEPTAIHCAMCPYDLA